MPLGTAAAPVAAKKKTPAPAAKRGANMVEYNVRGECPGIIRLIGVIDSVSDGVIMLKHKRRQSSKFALTPIPRTNVVLIKGDFKVGQGVEITYQSEKATFALFGRASIEGYDDKTGMMKGTDKDGQAFFFRPESCIATSTSEVDAPPIQPNKKY